MQLHLFCDASPFAMGASLFLRSEWEGKVSLRLVVARSRVAPVEQQTLTRLELMAALLGARLLKRYQHLMQLPHSHIWCWCDSDNVLYCVLRQRCTLHSSAVAYKNKRPTSSVYQHFLS